MYENGLHFSCHNILSRVCDLLQILRCVIVKYLLPGGVLHLVFILNTFIWRYCRYFFRETLINAMHIGSHYHFETEMIMIFYIIFCKNISTLNPEKQSFQIFSLNFRCLKRSGRRGLYFLRYLFSYNILNTRPPVTLLCYMCIPVFENNFRLWQMHKLHSRGSRICVCTCPI